ncbi:MAG: pglF 1, partial [Firmicutes bacterium]|nr:pglF 1 [Bacillota bacterium]
ILRRLRQIPNRGRTKVLIVGAGDAGAMLARELYQRYYNTKELIGFVDDDPYKQNKILFGVRVLGACQNVSALSKKYAIDEIIIAMPSVEGLTIRKIIKECQTTACSIKTVPGLFELLDGKITVQQLRNVELEDLLRRDPVSLDMPQIIKQLANKRVLVTGAGGSIGSELCRQIAKMKPASLYLVGKGENSIYEIERELKNKYPQLSIEPIIADVRDQQRINSLFSRIKPQIVFHAAAHKHVPLMERQPEEAVRNNIFGTQVVAEATDRCNGEIFILISTDKAVNPTSVMGATKRVAEMIIQNLNKVSATKYAAVRFGNVLGSRGSVVPLFKKQIAAGGPLTITHPEMKRYFMTIPEASQLVLQAGAMAKGGEVFVLDMGQPIKIVDMACDLIKLSGLVPYKDIEINFTGIRPGEKLFEELLTAEEGTNATQHSKIWNANLKEVDEAKLYKGLIDMKQAGRQQEIINLLASLVPTYSQGGEEKQQAAAAAKREAVGKECMDRLNPLPAGIN